MWLRCFCPQFLSNGAIWFPIYWESLRQCRPNSKWEYWGMVQSSSAEGGSEAAQNALAGIQGAKPPFIFIFDSRKWKMHCKVDLLFIFQKSKYLHLCTNLYHMPCINVPVDQVLKTFGDTIYFTSGILVHNSPNSKNTNFAIPEQNWPNWLGYGCGPDAARCGPPIVQIGHFC